MPQEYFYVPVDLTTRDKFLQGGKYVAEVRAVFRGGTHTSVRRP